MGGERKAAQHSTAGEKRSGGSDSEVSSAGGVGGSSSGEGKSGAVVKGNFWVLRFSHREGGFQLFDAYLPLVISLTEQEKKGTGNVKIFRSVNVVLNPLFGGVLVSMANGACRSVSVYFKLLLRRLLLVGLPFWKKLFPYRNINFCSMFLSSMFCFCFLTINVRDLM